MEKITIQKAGLNKVGQLQKIGKETFSEAFAAGNTKENLQQYLNESFSVEKLTAELKDQHAEFYFALLGNQVIGYLKINFGASQTELKEKNALEIERIYVLKEFYGKGVGQQLYNRAMEIARLRGVDYVWLGVWEENTRAIRFYKKNGFVEFDKHLFRLGKDEQTDIMMKLQVR